MGGFSGVMREGALKLFFEFAQCGDFLAGDRDLLDIVLALLEESEYTLFSVVG